MQSLYSVAICLREAHSRVSSEAARSILSESKQVFSDHLFFASLHLVAGILSSAKCPLGKTITMLRMCELKTEYITEPSEPSALSLHPFLATTHNFSPRPSYGKFQGVSRVTLLPLLLFL